jgi:hypothetical protein
MCAIPKKRAEITMKSIQRISFLLLTPVLLLFLGACSPVANPPQPQTAATVIINPSFQSQVSPIPTEATYGCGAWSSNNTPGPYQTITIYAKLTKNVLGVSGATAAAVVHFQSGDVPLEDQPQSDSGGYVSFQLPLSGRQPANVPTTVDVTFTNVPGYSGSIACSPAFFAPT